MIGKQDGYIVRSIHKMVATEVPWDIERVNALASTDIGAAVLHERVIVDPGYTAAAEALLLEKRAPINKMLKDLEEVEDMRQFVNLLNGELAKFVAPSIPALHLIPLRRMELGSGPGNPTIWQKKDQPLFLGYIGGARTAPTFVDGAYWHIVKRVLARMAEHQFSVDQVLDLITKKVRARMAGENIHARLADPNFPALYTLHALEALNARYMNMPEDETMKPMFFGLIVDLVKQLGPILSANRFTFMNTEKIRSPRLIDRLKAWLDTVQMLSFWTDGAVHELPLAANVVVMSGQPGRWQLNGELDWRQIYYARTGTDPAKGEMDIKSLDLGGLTTDVMLPTGSKADVNIYRLPYRTTKPYSTMALRYVDPIAEAGWTVEQYKSIEEHFNTSFDLRNYRPDTSPITIPIGSVNALVFPIKAPAVSDIQLEVIPSNISVKILTSDTLTAKGGACLDADLSDFNFVAQPVVTRVRAPWVIS